ncbi:MULTISPECIES: hypothetical protein [Methanobacterium]|nr:MULTISPECIES: hypothetical protein [Methanobacterium]
MPYKLFEGYDMNYKNNVELLDMKKLTTLDFVVEKLKELDFDFERKATCVAWTTFPYNEENLKTVEKALKKLNWRVEEYILNYDENLIFVKKDLE